MTSYVRKPHIRAFCDGSPLPFVVQADARHGYDLRISEATIVVPFDYLPDYVSHYSTIDLLLGATAATVEQSFRGLLLSFNYELYPGLVSLECVGTLIRAEHYENEEADGTDLSGLTDEEQVIELLDTCGIDYYHIEGTGIVLGTAAPDQFLWTVGETALSYIESLDQICLGYRTINVPSGAVHRIKISGRPAGPAARTFTEGIDIATGSILISPKDAYNRVHVSGYQDEFDDEPIFFVVEQEHEEVLGTEGFRTYPFSSPKIERESEDEVGDGLSCEAVALWQLGEVNVVKRTVTFATPREDVLIPGMVIEVVAEHLDSSDFYWLQSVRRSVDGAGKFQQELVCIGGDAVDSPIVYPPLADFFLETDKEEVIRSGSVTTIYVVRAQSVSEASSGTIVSEDWTAAGATPSTASGREARFVYTDIVNKVITLTIEDSQGVSKSITHQVPPESDSEFSKRQISLAATYRAEIYVGTHWKTDAEDTARPVVVTTNGPIWAAGPTIMLSEDMLGTSATEVQPFGVGTNVTALWTEVDAASSRIAAGASDGRVAYSADGGTTWLVSTGPAASAIKRIAIFRDAPDSMAALTSAGYYISHSRGIEWALEQASLVGETFEDFSLSHTRNLIAMSGGRKLISNTGVQQVLPNNVDIVAVTADIIEDRFYCIAADGTTYYTTENGGVNYTQGANLPTGGSVLPRSLWRDGRIRGLLYFVKGTGGAFKSIDGFATSGGYEQIRAPGIGGEDASADYRQIGLNGILLTSLPTPPLPPITPTIIFSTDQGKAKDLWIGVDWWDHTNADPPAGWEQVDYDDSAWVPMVYGDHNSFQAMPGSTFKVWWTADPAQMPSQRNAAFRWPVTLPLASIGSAQLVLAADDDALGAWVNGTYIGQEVNNNSGPATALTVPVEVLTPGGTNIIAIHVRNVHGGFGFISAGIQWYLELNP